MAVAWEEVLRSFPYPHHLCPCPVPSRQGGHDGDRAPHTRTNASSIIGLDAPQNMT